MAAVALITGATGLIGRHVLAGWTADDLDPVPVDSSTDLLAPGAARALVARVGPSVVVHLAWTASGTAGYRDDARNDAWVAASQELADACADSGAWFVGTGTGVDDALDAPDAYTAAKARLRRALTPRIEAGTCSWVRPYYVVDPERRRPALVADALRARETGEPLRLRTPGSRHDFVHAGDVGEAVRTVVRHRLAGAVAVGSGEVRPVSDLVRALGVTWAPGAPAQPGPQHAPTGTQASQQHDAADVVRLRDHGWTPSRTKEMFQGV